SDKRVHFGLATDKRVRLLEITWPSGIVQQLEKIEADQILKVVEPRRDSPQRTQRTQRKRLTKTKVRRKGKLMNLFSVIFAEKRQDRKKIDGKDISSFVFPLRDSLFESKKTRNFLPFASYLSFA